MLLLEVGAAAVGWVAALDRVAAVDVQMAWATPAERARLERLLVGLREDLDEQSTRLVAAGRAYLRDAHDQMVGDDDHEPAAAVVVH